MTPLSQRDARWAKIKLGTSNKTIGSHGCIVTCLAMLAGTTPDIVNSRLLEVGGYAEGNLVIWAKISEALPNLQFIYRHYIYNNEDVKGNLPCLVEVDAKRIGGTRHWVVYVGNKKMYDPWFGNEKSTSYYPPVAYVTMQVKGDFIGESPYGGTFEKYGYPTNIPHEALEEIFSKYHEWRDKLHKKELLTKEECLQTKKELKTKYERHENARKHISKLLFNDEGADFDKIIEEINTLIKDVDEDREPVKFASDIFQVLNKELEGIYMYPKDLNDLLGASKLLLARWKKAYKAQKEVEIEENKQKVVNGEEVNDMDLNKKALKEQSITKGLSLGVGASLISVGTTLALDNAWTGLPYVILGLAFIAYREYIKLKR